MNIVEIVGSLYIAAQVDQQQIAYLTQENNRMTSELEYLKSEDNARRIASILDDDPSIETIHAELNKPYVPMAPQAPSEVTDHGKEEADRRDPNAV